MARPSTLAEAPPSAGAASKPAGVLDFFDRTFKYWAVLPTVIVLTLLTIQPALQLIQMSVSDVQFSGGQLQWTFVGLDNFKYLATDVVFPVALRNTLIFVVCVVVRSEEHTSELQSRENLVCRLLLEKKNNKSYTYTSHTGRP